MPFSTDGIIQTFEIPSMVLWVGFKGMLLLAGVLVLIRTLAARTPEWRHRIWLTGMLGILILPPLAFFGPAVDLPCLPGQTRTAEPPDVMVGGQAPDLAKGRENRSSDAAQAPSFASIQKVADNSAATLLLLACWSIGGAISLLPTLLGVVLLVFHRRWTRPVTDPQVLRLLEQLCRQVGVGRPIELLDCENSAASPMTWGLIKPRILIPSTMLATSESQLRLILLHELMHIQRCDWVWMLVARLAAAVHWFNPLAWYALSRMHVEAEYDCDARVIRVGEKQSDYAQCLWQVARASRHCSQSGVSAMTFYRSSNIVKRIQFILNQYPASQPAFKRSFLGWAVVLFCCVSVLGTVRIVRSESSNSESTSVETATQPSSADPPATDRALVGTWKCNVLQGGEHFEHVFIFTEDGKVENYIISKDQPYEESGESVRYFANQGKLTLKYYATDAEVDLLLTIHGAYEIKDMGKTLTVTMEMHNAPIHLGDFKKVSN